jgi:mRNA-degrading endonuclease YafQ of YafQ-DinJ toxin-antitoxin module
MNKNVHYTTQFKKDFKLYIKRGYNMQQIKSIMNFLKVVKNYLQRIKIIVKQAIILTVGNVIYNPIGY